MLFDSTSKTFECLSTFVLFYLVSCKNKKALGFCSHFLSGDLSSLKFQTRIIKKWWWWWTPILMRVTKCGPPGDFLVTLHTLTPPSCLFLSYQFSPSTSSKWSKGWLYKGLRNFSLSTSPPPWLFLLSFLSCLFLQNCNKSRSRRVLATSASSNWSSSSHFALFHSRQKILRRRLNL